MLKHLLMLCLLFASGAAFAQQGETEISQVIGLLFTSMQKGDTAAMRSCFHEEIRMQTAILSTKSGNTRLVTENADDFMKEVASMTRKKVVMEERVKELEIRVDYPMATVWAPYEFYVNGKFSHSGVDAFQLFKTKAGWKIIQLCDTRKAPAEK